MLCVVAVQEKIVGDKAFASRRQFLLLDHRMAAVDDLEVARLLRILMKSWPAIIAQGRDVCQASEHVDFGQCQRGLADALGLAGNRGS